MRGRKRQAEVAPGTHLRATMEKKIPSGFGGLRGKRADVQEGLEQERALQEAFIGLRGGGEEQS